MAVIQGGRYRAALAVGEFRAISTARLVSILGDSAAYLAVTVLVFERTGSPLLSSLTFAIAFVPYLFGGTLLSALVDRVPPRRLIAGTDLLAAALVLLLVIPEVPIAVVFMALFLIGTMAPVRGGCVDAMVAAILPAEAYVAGRSVQRIISQGAQIVGVGLGGVLIGPLGPRGALVVDTASFAGSALVIRFGVRRRAVPAVPGAARTGLLSDSVAGLREVWARPAVRRLLLLGWAVPFVAVAPEALAAPALAESGTATGLIGVWMMAIPVGMIAGDLAAVLLVPAAIRLRATRPLASLIPLVLICFAARPSFWASIGLLFVSGCAAAYGLGVDQLLRDVTPATLLGRTFALNGTGLMVCQGLGFVSAGALGDVLSPHIALAVTGMCGLVAVGCLPLGAVRRAAAAAVVAA